MAGVIGKGLTSESGSGQISYGTRARVSLQGPFQFFVPSENRGALFYGKSTVLVGKNCNFTLQMPTIALTCSDGEFGVDLDRSGDGWIHVFRGEATLWLHDSGVETTRKIVLGESESVQIGQRGGGCVATVIHDARLAASLASRLPPRMPRQESAAFAERKATDRLPAQTPPQAALARKQDISRPPGTAANTAAASEGGTSAMLILVSMPGSPSGAAGPTCRTFSTRFSLAQLAPRVNPSALVPGTSMLHLRFVAQGVVITAMRLNGQEVPLPEQRSDGAVRQVGAVMIRDGFVGGNRTDVLELDVRSHAARDRLLEAPVFGANPPVVVTAEVWTRNESMPAPPQASSAEGKAKRAK